MMRCPGRRVSAGLTIFEFLVVLIMISGLFGLFMRSVLELEVDVERVQMKRTVSRLQSGLANEFADRIVRQGTRSVASMDGMNPVDAMIHEPDGYVGEIEGTDGFALEPGKWYFDTKRGVLLYRVENKQYFSAENGDKDIARFRVNLKFRDADGDGRYEPPADRPRGIRLEPENTFVWKQ